MLQASSSSSLMRLSVSCWNVLADAYAHKGALLDSVRWSYRFDLITKCVASAQSDLFCLQEVDHFDDSFKPLFDRLGYESVYLQRPNRRDGCLIAFNSSEYELMDTEKVYFDDIVELVPASRSTRPDHFERQNVAVITKLRSKRNKEKELIASCAHLYWNPNKPDVKLAQTLYLLDRVHKMRKNEEMPVIMCGDYNSLPESELYGVITDEGGYDPAIEDFSLPKLLSKAHSLDGGAPKFVADHSLNRLCRWMRVLGMNVALESKESQNARQSRKSDFAELFQHAKDQRRIILTTSKQMLERSNCPQAYLVPSNRLRNLEGALVDICREFNIVLEPNKFLTICGKCGGEIQECDTDHPRYAAFTFPPGRPVYSCIDCHQPYWWNDKETSSPARAMKMADTLYQTIKSALESDEAEAAVEALGTIPELPSADGGGSKAQETGVSEADQRGDRKMGDEQPQNVSAKLTELFDGRELYMTNMTTKLNTQGNGGPDADVSSIEALDTVPDVEIDRDCAKINGADVETSIIREASAEGHICDDECKHDNQHRQLKSRLKLQSAFMKYHGKEPPCTNWAHGFNGTLDYTFITPKVKVLSATVFPDIDLSALTRQDPAAVQAAIDARSREEEDLSTMTVSDKDAHELADVFDSKMAMQATSVTSMSASAATQTSPGPALRKEVKEAKEASAAAVELELPVDPTPEEDANQPLRVNIRSPQPSETWPSDHFMIVTELEL